MKQQPTHEQLQHLVDQAASFNVYTMADGQTPGGVISGAGRSAAVLGIEGSQTLHRFAIDLDLPTQQEGVRASNRISGAIGRLDFRWMIVPEGYLARADREPPATTLDSSRSQRFVMQEGVFSWGEGGDGFYSFGAGRTFPTMQVGGRQRLDAMAVGILTGGFGRLQGYRGNFTVSGEWTPEGSFQGNLMMRIVDPEGRLRTWKELPEMEAVTQPDPNTTFLTWIAQKSKTPDQENSFSVNSDGQVRGLNIPVGLKRVQVDFIPGGSSGLTALDLRLGEMIGREIGFGRESVPRAPGRGTELTPFQFEGVSNYTFYDVEGRSVGSFTANVVEGRSMQMQLPGAEEQPALRFGYFGPIVEGFGCFEGVHGFLCGAAGSVFAPPPADHVISNMYVARIFDPQGRFRISSPIQKFPSTTTTYTSPSITTSPKSRADQFGWMVEALDGQTSNYTRWRAAVRKCAAPLGRAIASNFAALAGIGDFEDLSIDADRLRRIFEAEIGQFDRDEFERYKGPAKGTFKFYDLTRKQQSGSSTLHSYWEPKTKIAGERYYQRVTASALRYYGPDDLPDLTENVVDLTVNAYRRDTGLCSYVSMYQGGRQLKTSFGYKLPNPYEELWFVRNLNSDGSNSEGNDFMLSHEWKGMRAGREFYFMTGIFLNIDFENCVVSIQGDQFWRAVYEEDVAATV